MVTYGKVTDDLRREVERRMREQLQYVHRGLMWVNDAVDVAVKFVEEERERYDDLRKAAERFVWKCENGRAHSRESYRQFTEALARCAPPEPTTERCPECANSFPVVMACTNPYHPRNQKDGTK